MRYLSLFTGIGGFELGIKQAYEDLHHRGTAGARGDHGGNEPNADRADAQGPPHCVGYSEIDRYASQIYQAHFPEHKNYGDITKINEKELPDFDLLCGGFPCQAFSIAGLRGGFSDTRGTLFFDIARILSEKRPRLLLLENVKGLLSHDGGRTFKTIIASLTDLGYDLQWQVLNSKNHGVPQNRERVFIVGHLRGTPRPEVFTLGEVNRGTEEARSEERQEVANTLKAKQGGPDLENSYLIDLKAPTSTKRGMRSEDGIAKTLDHNCAQGWIGEQVIRKLTPLECERLQGFPDNWTKGLSDTQRYKTIGNAVTVNVIRDIMHNLSPTPPLRGTATFEQEYGKEAPKREGECPMRGRMSQCAEGRCMHQGEDWSRG